MQAYGEVRRVVGDGAERGRLPWAGLLPHGDRAGDYNRPSPSIANTASSLDRSGQISRSEELRRLGRVGAPSSATRLSRAPRPAWAKSSAASRSTCRSAGRAAGRALYVEPGTPAPARLAALTVTPPLALDVVAVGTESEPLAAVDSLAA